jgi:hypothetical protein
VHFNEMHVARIAMRPAGVRCAGSRSALRRQRFTHTVLFVFARLSTGMP